MTIVYLDGIFDIPHEGHLNMVRQAYEKGKELSGSHDVRILIGICDEGVAQYKRAPVMTLEERAESVKRLVKDFPAVVVSIGVPIAITEAFIKEHHITIVIRGDDFDVEQQKKFYAAAMKAATFATVPYTKGVSTSQALIDAKTKGTLPLTSTAHLCISPDVLIKRIQEKTWEELGITHHF